MVDSTMDYWIFDSNLWFRFDRENIPPDSNRVSIEEIEWMATCTKVEFIPLLMLGCLLEALIVVETWPPWFHGGHVLT